jgi:hypothetical protein
VRNKPDNLPLRQLWHVLQGQGKNVKITAKTEEGTSLTPITQKGWYSSFYGAKEPNDETVFSTEFDVVETVVEVKGRM